MRPALFLVALVAAAASGPAAQVNTERMRRALDGDGVVVSADASAAFATGNTEFFQLGLGGRADARFGADLAFLVGRLDFAETEAARFVDRSFLHARYNRRLAPRLVGEAFGQVERNRQQGLEQRYLVGGGARVELVERDSLGLAAGVTPMLEVEVLATGLGGQQDAVARLSSYVSGRVQAASGVAVSAVAYVQPRADVPADLRVLSQVSLEVPLSRLVRMRVQANLRHDTRPPAGIERTDLGVENGLVLVFPAR